MASELTIQVLLGKKKIDNLFHFNSSKYPFSRKISRKNTKETTIKYAILEHGEEQSFVGLLPVLSIEYLDNRYFSGVRTLVFSSIYKRMSPTVGAQYVFLKHLAIATHNSRGHCET